MTDAEYLFKQDIKEKKAAGRGAFHKKASVKGPKGCRMPSDYLTRKEKNAMNGEVVTWSPKAYYTWEEFKAFPNNIQHDYLKALCEKYECGVNAVVTGIFGVQPARNLQKYLKVRGWDRAEFGSAAHGTAARIIVARIREDVERAHSQVDKFNEKWGLTEETGEETDTSENEEIAAEEEIPEWQQILEEEKRKSAEAAFRRSREAKEAEEAEEEDPIPLHAETEEKKPGATSPHLFTFGMTTSCRFSPDALTNLKFIRATENWANRRLRFDGHLFLNDVLKELGIDPVPEGQFIGWCLFDSKDGVVISTDVDKFHPELKNEKEILLDFNCTDDAWNKVFQKAQDDISMLQAAAPNEPDILASYIEFVCSPDKLADLSAVAALFSGADEVSVTIRTVKK